MSCRYPMLSRDTPPRTVAPNGNCKGRALWKIVPCALLILGSAAAQTTPTSVTEPILGLVFDGGTQTVRALMGIPAASWVDGTLDGTPLSAAAISSQQVYALALEAGTGAALLVSQSGKQPLAGVRAGAQLLAVSPSGTAASSYKLLYPKFLCQASIRE